MKLSDLNKTWIFDIDGTIVKHNGYKNGNDVLLEGVRETFNKIDKNDKIILLTSREEKYIPKLKKFLKENNIRYNYIISNLPFGERILINDIKPSGLKCAYAINKKRDEKLNIDYEIEENI
ncbi:MAG: hypothetical protein IJ877_06515 [Candidatus Gastranaerophilales bacterium]|nr:hypothetical protein [Candidatus Gastranaerophilales bacterium]